MILKQTLICGLLELGQSEVTMLTPVKNIMTTGLINIFKGTSLHHAYRLMQKNKIRHLPVEDDNGNIVGVVSQRELTTHSTVDDIPVEFVMNSSVEYIDQNVSLKVAIQKMLQQKISCVLITNEDAKPIGIVTTDDLLAYLAHLLDDENDQNHKVLNVLNLQTIGKVADSLSTIGI